MNSLRNKIILSFGLSNLAILIIALVAFTDLSYLQDQIVEGEKLKDFLASTQQLQVEENNFFLSSQPESYSSLRKQADLTRSMYKDLRAFFDSVAEESELEQLDTGFQEYSNLLENLPNLSRSTLNEVQENVRTTSQEVTLMVRDFSQRHHEMLNRVTKLASWTLVIALTVVIAMGGIAAVIVSRHVEKPIRNLEKQLDAVADGRKKKLNIDSDDIEIQSFVQHFNTMLDRLRSQQSELRHHEKAAALGVLVSGVAHELNNPLSNISTSVQLLMEDDDTDRELGKQWLTHVDNETERARRIVKRLLDSVRHPVLNMQDIHADELVRAAVLLIHRQLDADILLHIEDVPDTCVHVDRERMQQVFINLIHNAVDAGAQNIWIFADKTTWAESSPEDIERVQGEVSYISGVDELLLFTVADDGPGIPEKNLTQLFTPFFTTKSGGEGTGLGLYLVEEIIDEHDGCITVENQKDGGTQFLIWLPITCEECIE